MDHSRCPRPRTDYTEPKRLARLGYLVAPEEPGSTHERTVYTLTDRALRVYAGTPVTFPPLKSDPLLRLLICDLVGEYLTRESMATLRDDIADSKPVSTTPRTPQAKA